MKIQPTPQHFLNLIHDVDQQLKMTWLSDGCICLIVQKYLAQWSSRYDCSGDSYCQCMLDSFRLAAVRGFSGNPADVERSIRSLGANIDYYQVRMEKLNLQSMTCAQDELALAG